MVCEAASLYFCLDTKVPKNQDLYVRRLGSRPSLLKSANSLRSNSADFLTQGRPASILRNGECRNGRMGNEGGTNGMGRRGEFFIVTLSFSRCFSFLGGHFWRHTLRRMKKRCLALRNPHVWAKRVSRILARWRFFKYAGRIGLEFLVTFVSMTKVTRALALHYIHALSYSKDRLSIFLWFLFWKKRLQAGNWHSNLE